MVKGRTLTLLVALTYLYLKLVQVTAVQSGRMEGMLEIKLKHKVRASQHIFISDFSAGVFRLNV